MSREVKFRFWKGNTNEMLSLETALKYLVDVPTLLNGGYDHFKPLQYTGLKDKNGKEIYEGDIVKGKAYEFNNCPRIIGEVIYDYCEFKVRSRREKTSLMKAELNTTYEVIGNIHKNPELLQP